MQAVRQVFTMELSSIDAYEKKVLSFVSSYERILDKVINAWFFIIMHFISLFRNITVIFGKTLSISGKFMRYSTYPIHWIWIKNELKLKDNAQIEDLPLFQVGGHYIYGKPGSGKSTVVYHAMMDYAYYTGKCSYTTEMMEMPRINLSGREYFYHQLFQPSDFFQDGEQISSFDDHYNVIVYEEMLTKYQQRNNKEKGYNSEVLPMIAAMGTQRHQGIDMFYFISQLPRNDIALMQMLSWYHEPKIKKAFDYKLWLDTGKIRFYIKGWHIKSYSVTPKSGYDYDLKLQQTWFYDCVHHDDMTYFNRLNMKSKYAKLPKMKGAPMEI